VSGRRIPIGSLVGAAGALLLLVGLFLDWYEDMSAFTAFEVLDLVLAALAAGALVALAEPLGFGVRLGVSPMVLGIAATAIVASQLINPPPAAVDLKLELGAWLSLAGALLIVVGSLPEVARVSLAVDVEQRGPDEQGRPAAAQRGAGATTDPDAPTATQGDAPTATQRDVPGATQRDVPGADREEPRA
jgi:hypothetical protein